MTSPAQIFQLIFDTLEETGYRFSPFAKVVVFLLTSRAAWGDIKHGNINLYILFCFSHSLHRGTHVGGARTAQSLDALLPGT